MPELDLEKIMEMAQNAQNELQKAQDNLDSVEVEGVSGGGLVKVRASAKGRIIAIAIDDSLMNVDEKAMLEDLIAAALNDVPQILNVYPSDANFILVKTADGQRFR